MKIVVLGARGFIGGRIAYALEEDGHLVIRGARPEYDLSRPRSASDWAPLLVGAELLVNAVGIFRESSAGTFEDVQHRGPVGLFEACAASRVPVIQVSALGADESAETAFLRTKGAADAALLRLDVPSLVLRPSLVFGAEGASSRQFLAMAASPFIPLPGAGDQRIQPVHVDDVVDAVRRAVATRLPRAIVAAVGPAPTTLREYFATLRHSLALPGPRFLRVPMWVVRAAARLRIGMLDRDALRMLEQGNTADVAPFADLLGRAPRRPAQFIAPPERDALRARANIDALLPLLRIAIAIVWLTAGVVSAGLYPVESSLELLERTRITGPFAYVALYGAAALDFAIGVAILVLERRRWLWTLQAAIILAYTAIITIFLPEQWLHPYGPVVKNLPMLAAILLLHRMEPR